MSYFAFKVQPERGFMHGIHSSLLIPGVHKYALKCYVISDHKLALIDCAFTHIIL